MKRILFILVMFLVSCSRDVPEGVTELVYASPYPPSHPFSQADQEWMEYVETQTGGSLKIRPSWSGALLSSENSMLELRHGIADIGLITPIYEKGGTHLLRVQSGFYAGITTIPQQIALYHCLQNNSPQFAEELEGLHVLAVQGGSLLGIITTDKRVTTLDDLNGLRLRVPGELVGVMSDMGVDPLTMPMGEVYPALTKGMVDGVVSPVDTFRSLHFADVASHFAELDIPRGAYPARAIRKTRWLSLTDDQRKVLDESIVVWEGAIARQVEGALELGREHALAQGVTFTEINNTDKRQFMALYLEHAAAAAASLQKYNIDGLSVYALARASVQNDGTVSCNRGNN